MYYATTKVEYCSGDQIVEFSLNRDEPTEELKRRVACLHGADYFISSEPKTDNTVDFTYFDVSYTLEED